MTRLDWAVLCATLGAIVAYGVWRTRGVTTVDRYLRGGQMRWWTIGLSIIATQASAITFLSTPGQAYADGLGFLQFYFGLPIAMVLLAALVVPIYYRLRVYTAYQYLEGRFDRKTRQLVALLFLISRGLAAGLSIYAPAIIVSAVLGWSVAWTTVIVGGLTIAYTVSGGTRAVSATQTWQMAVALGGMALAFVLILHRLPDGVGFSRALSIAGALGHAKAVDLSFRAGERYTLWTGLGGGLFVALAYFGTDQSQVQRYLSGSSLAESRLGLLATGLVKVPMQLGILLTGLMVFVFYQFNAPPAFFHQAAIDRIARGPHAGELRALEARHGAAFDDKRVALDRFVAAGDAPSRATLKQAQARLDGVRGEVSDLVARSLPGENGKDADYVFLTFVTRELPSGVVGLLIAVILCAAMSASASALNALGSTSVVDFYRVWRPAQSDGHYLAAAKLFTVGWGAVAVSFAGFAALLDNLIQAVNILGSIFYGPMLGVFLVGFFMKRVGANAAFFATLAAQALVVATFALTRVAYLWYNVIGCGALVAIALLLQPLMTKRAPAPP